MTAVPPPVPPEIVERAAEEFFLTDEPAAWQLQAAEESLAAVYGDIVEAARRDALTAAAEAIAHEREQDRGYRVAEGFDEEPCDGPHGACHAAAAYFAFDTAARIVTDLATAPRTAPAATVSVQDTVPRIPTTPEAVSGHSGPREEDAETYTVSDIRAAFAAASPDDWGVPCHYETTMLLALRGGDR